MRGWQAEKGRTGEGVTYRGERGKGSWGVGRIGEGEARSHGEW